MQSKYLIISSGSVFGQKYVVLYIAFTIALVYNEAINLCSGFLAQTPVIHHGTLTTTLTLKEQHAFFL